MSAGQDGNRGWYPGNVLLNILTPNEQRTKILPRGLYEMTQIDFVRFLIAGPDTEFGKEIAKASIEP